MGSGRKQIVVPLQQAVINGYVRHYIEKLVTAVLVSGNVRNIDRYSGQSDGVPAGGVILRCVRMMGGSGGGGDGWQ